MPATIPTLHGPILKPLSGGKPRALVVLLHGVGRTGTDMIGLAPHWAEMLPDAEFVAPDGPFPCDTGPSGRQWFSLQDRGPDALFAGISSTAPIVNDFLNGALAARGLDGGKLALVGFSQGTVMALHVAPRRASQMAGLVGYSGALRRPDRLPEDIRSRPPMLLIHGDADPIIPIAALASAESALAAHHVPVETFVCPGLGHSIDEAGVARGGEFLRRVLGPGSI